MSENPFGPFLDAQGFVVLDGGLATELEAGGHTLDTALWSARLLLDAPDALRSVHRSYLEAGADCITSAGYQASFEGFQAAGLDRPEAEHAIRRAVELAVEARDAFWSGSAHLGGRLEPIVAASAGPYGAFLADGSEYHGRYGVGRDVLDAFHRERLDVLLGTRADVIGFETIPSLLETEVIAALLTERPSARAWISFSCRDSSTLRDGTSIVDAVDACTGVQSLAALGVNCTAPRHVVGLIDRLRTKQHVPIIAYPNSGEHYDPGTHTWSGGDASGEWLQDVGAWVASGARIIGGCCRVGPREIRTLRLRLEEMHAL